MLLVSYAVQWMQNGSGLWENFQKTYNKTYDNEADEESRRKIFWKGIDTVMIHNLKYKLGLSSFTLGVNQFSDQTLEEFLGVGNESNNTQEFDDEIEGLNYNPVERFTIYNDFDEIPNSFDWRDQNAISPVKDQKRCGSCYAMAVISSIESKVSIRTGNLTELSVQEVIDCARNYTTFGCSGGVLFRTYDYVKDKGGLNSEADYPSEGKKGECRATSSKVKIDLKGFGVVMPYSNSRNLMKALVENGPLAVAIDVDTESFMRYSGGIYNEACRMEINHAALLIGYGSEDGTNFFIIKNSWSHTWGDKGFMRIARRDDDSCLFASGGLYPILN